MTTTLQKLIAGLFFLVSLNVAYASEQIECSDAKSGISVHIDSSCELPVGAEENAGSTSTSDNEMNSVISVYRNGTLESQDSYSCSGVHKEDIFFYTDFENVNRAFSVFVQDNYGLDYATWIDTIMDGKQIRLSDCK